MDDLGSLLQYLYDNRLGLRPDLVSSDTMKNWVVDEITTSEASTTWVVGTDIGSTGDKVALLVGTIQNDNRATFGEVTFNKGAAGDDGNFGANYNGNVTFSGKAVSVTGGLYRGERFPMVFEDNDEITFTDHSFQAGDTVSKIIVGVVI